MKNYGRVRGSISPAAIEITKNAVFVASNVQEYTETIEDKVVSGYEYDYIQYDKDEYIQVLASRANALEEELQATKILLGVE